MRTLCYIPIAMILGCSGLAIQGTPEFTGARGDLSVDSEGNPSSSGAASGQWGETSVSISIEQTPDHLTLCMSLNQVKTCWEFDDVPSFGESDGDNEESDESGPGDEGQSDDGSSPDVQTPDPPLTPGSVEEAEDSGVTET